MEMRQSQSGPLLSTFSNVQASPKWSMRGKGPNLNKTSTPGPGAYSASETTSQKFGKSPNYGFGYAARDGARPQSAPGPGHYDRPTNPGKNVSAKYGFGTSDRIVRQQMEQPGPASYKLRGAMGEDGPKYSSVGRRDTGRGKATPGPGAYQPVDSRGTQKFGFGTSPRDSRINGASPGPGAYDQGTATTAGPKFSMKAKNEAFAKDLTPGPGQYGGIYTSFG